jgi:hypothetical protein
MRANPRDGDIRLSVATRKSRDPMAKIIVLILASLDSATLFAAPDLRVASIAMLQDEVARSTRWIEPIDRSFDQRSRGRAEIRLPFKCQRRAGNCRYVRRMLGRGEPNLAILGADVEETDAMLDRQCTNERVGACCFCPRKQA